jgi:hypothetical protein
MESGNCIPGRTERKSQVPTTRSLSGYSAIPDSRRSPRGFTDGIAPTLVIQPPWPAPQKRTCPYKPLSVGVVERRHSAAGIERSNLTHLCHNLEQNPAAEQALGLQQDRSITA